MTHHLPLTMHIDTTYTISTPEGIQLQLSPSGPLPRMYAWIIDTLIRTGIIVTLFIILAFLGNLGIGIALILTFALEWFYPVYFEVFHQGQTPGKKTLDIYVTHEDGTPVTLSASLIRNFLRVVDFLPFMYGFAIISMLLNKKFQRLGDLAAGTVVLYTPEKYSKITVPDVPPIQPSIPLQLQEQQALIAFLHRSTMLTNERAIELAELTGPLVKDVKDPHLHISGMGQWLSGIR